MADSALKDLLVFNPSNLRWEDISAGLNLQHRMAHGVAASGGKLYVHGGMPSGQIESNELHTDITAVTALCGKITTDFDTSCHPDP